jgi:FtsP/CotA-like multicopper oxidase with cupredoxin domain
MFILDDPEADALPLPDQYGVDDIPLIIQDKRLHRDGSLDFSQRLISPTGRLGERFLSTAPTVPTSRSATSGCAFACSTRRTPASTTSASPTTVNST